MFRQDRMTCRYSLWTLKEPQLLPSLFFFSHGSSECIKMQNQRLYEVGGNIGKRHSMIRCYCWRGVFFPHVL